MTKEPIITRDQARSLAAIISMISVVGLMFGLTLPLLGIIMEQRGLPGSVIGANTAMPALALILFTPLLPGLLKRFGTRPVLFISLGIEAVSVLAFRIFDDLAMWFAIRFVMGAAAAALFTVSEAWINEMAPPDRRGRVMGIYTAVLVSAFAVGAILIRFTGVDGWTPFAIGAALMLVAGLPLIFSDIPSQALEGEPSGHVFSFLRIAPMATAAAIAAGAMETGGFGLLPPYGLRNGFDVAGVSQLLAVAAVGQAVLQFPIGWLADHMNRVTLLMICAAAGAAGSLLMPFVTGTPAILFPCLFLWAGMATGMYTVGLTLLGERFRGADLVGANSAFIMLYGAGALAGPPMIGASMDIWDPHGYAMCLAAVFLAYLLLGAVRSVQRRRG